LRIFSSCVLNWTQCRLPHTTPLGGDENSGASSMPRAHTTLSEAPPTSFPETRGNYTASICVGLFLCHSLLHYVYVQAHSRFASILFGLVRMVAYASHGKDRMTCSIAYTTFGTYQMMNSFLRDFNCFKENSSKYTVFIIRKSMSVPINHGRVSSLDTVSKS